MAIKDRIKEARLNKKYTQEQLAKLIGVAKSTVTGYEKGNSEPSIEIIIKIMNALDVDANYLWQDDMDINYPAKVSYEEFERIKKYRVLTPHGKDIVDYILDKEYELSIKPNLTSDAMTRLVPYFYKLASAGTGQIIFDTPPTKTIEIPIEYRNVDYALGVNGNSMSPDYEDGDTLLVRMTSNIQKGEVGIFQVNGMCYVKKLGDGKLLSINKDYDDIELNETATCLGKVIDKLH